MLIRSVALFVHIVAMLGLFVGLALEWLSLESLRTSTAREEQRIWTRALRGLPRYMATAVGLILISGIYLAARVGVLDLGWVRVSFGAMLLMGILGGPVLRAPMRILQRAADDDGGGDTPATVRRHASHPLLRVSLRTRTAVALAIVYLMIGKPDLCESFLFIAGALALGAAVSMPQRRPHSSAVGAR
jgi:uncharacterized membrane protein